LRERSRCTYALLCACCFLSNAPPTTAIYTLSLHDALPISTKRHGPRRAPGRSSGGADHALPGLGEPRDAQGGAPPAERLWDDHLDRKSTRLNSSHVSISYAVFCLKKNNTQTYGPTCPAIRI